MSEFRKMAQNRIWATAYNLVAMRDSQVGKAVATRSGPFERDFRANRNPRFIFNGPPQIRSNADGLLPLLFRILIAFRKDPAAR